MMSNLRAGPLKFLMLPKGISYGRVRGLIILMARIGILIPMYDKEKKVRVLKRSIRICAHKRILGGKSMQMWPVLIKGGLPEASMIIHI